MIPNQFTFVTRPFIIGYIISGSSLFTILLIILYRQKILLLELKEQHNKRNKQLRSLLSEQIIVHHRKQTVVGLYIHQQLIGSLTAIQLHFHHFSQHTSEEFDELLNAIDHALSEAITSAYAIADDLYPVLIESFGLEDALKDWIKSVHMARQSKINLIYQQNGSLTLQNQLMTYQLIKFLLVDDLRTTVALQIMIHLAIDDSGIVIRYQKKPSAHDSGTHSLKPLLEAYAFAFAGELLLETDKNETFLITMKLNWL